MDYNVDLRTTILKKITTTLVAYVMGTLYKANHVSNTLKSVYIYIFPIWYIAVCRGGEVREETLAVT